MECICTCARAHPFSIFFRLPLLGNGWADCIEIWYALGDPLVTAYAVVTGGVSLHVHTALLYLRNGSADWVQFWYVSWGSWTRCLTHVMGGVSLHVRTCRPRFCISGTARPIGFNFGVWDGGHELGASHKSWVGYLCTCARADRTYVSQDRLGRLCSNLVCGLGVTKYVLSTSHGWNGASLHMRTCTPTPTPTSVSQDLIDQFC